MNESDFSKAIRVAIRACDVERVQELVRAHIDFLNLVTQFGTWLHVASRVGSLDVVKCLVELGADVNRSAGTFETGPLTTAASSGHNHIVRYLLQHGAVFDLSEPFKNPLFSAIHANNLDLVKLLVAHGIDTSVRYTGDVMTDMDAIGYANHLGHHEIAEYLQKEKPNNTSEGIRRPADGSPKPSM